MFLAFGPWRLEWSGGYRFKIGYQFSVQHPWLTRWGWLESTLSWATGCLAFCTDRSKGGKIGERCEIKPPDPSPGYPLKVCVNSSALPLMTAQLQFFHHQVHWIYCFVGSQGEWEQWASLPGISLHFHSLWPRIYTWPRVTPLRTTPWPLEHYSHQVWLTLPPQRPPPPSPYWCVWSLIQIWMWQHHWQVLGIESIT